jgi:hypothetical protein
VSSWAILFLIPLVLVSCVIVIALWKKDFVCAAVRFRSLGFFLEAKNNSEGRSESQTQLPPPDKLKPRASI